MALEGSLPPRFCLMEVSSISDHLRLHSAAIGHVLIGCHTDAQVLSVMDEVETMIYQELLPNGSA
jgi:hypothetical protein